MSTIADLCRTNVQATNLHFLSRSLNWPLDQRWQYRSTSMVVGLQMVLRKKMLNWTNHTFCNIFNQKKTITDSIGSGRVDVPKILQPMKSVGKSLFVLSASREILFMLYCMELTRRIAAGSSVNHARDM